jgi:hypothetical protein
MKDVKSVTNLEPPLGRRGQMTMNETNPCVCITTG